VHLSSYSTVLSKKASTNIGVQNDGSAELSEIFFDIRVSRVLIRLKKVLPRLNYHVVASSRHVDCLDAMGFYGFKIIQYQSELALCKLQKVISIPCHQLLCRSGVDVLRRNNWKVRVIVPNGGAICIKAQDEVTNKRHYVLNCQLIR
jgi:hypothetical protein